MGSIKFSWNVCVKGLVHSGGAWVFRRGKLLVMTLHVLIFEMGVEDLGVGKHAKYLIMCFAFMNKFMTSLCFNSTNKSDDKPKHYELWPGDRPYGGQVIRIKFDVITKET